MKATLNTLSFSEARAAIQASVGRPVCTAERLEMTTFEDCVRNDFWWGKEACYSLLHDTKEEALAHAAQNGFYPSGKSAGDLAVRA